jgi:hypothetical protein
MPNDIEVAGEAVALNCNGVPEEVAREVENETVTIHWSRDAQLNDAQLNALLQGERTLGEIWVDDLWVQNDHYLWELEKSAIRHVLDRNDLEHVTVSDFLDQHPDSRPMIDENMDRLLKNSWNAYVGVELDLDHPDIYGGMQYEDVKPVLDLLNIDPESMLVYLPIENVEPHPERRGNEVADPSNVAEAWVNMGYAGRYVVMLAHQHAADVVRKRAEIEEQGLVLEPGTRLIIHSFAVGSSSTTVQLQRELRIEPEMIEDIYNDKAARYGIQATCGLVSEAWNGRWHLPKSE